MAGIDKMVGGLGDDTYIVDNTADVVVEAANQGVDLVKSSATYTLSANVEHLTLTGGLAINGTGNGMNNILIGNGAANKLMGGAGNDTLDGGAGNDTLDGGAGNDTYFVDSKNDVITEAAGMGTDTVFSKASEYQLSVNVENLTLLDGAISGTGNALANVLIGNGVANTLTGGAGNDTLDGGIDSDTLIGGGRFRVRDRQGSRHRLRVRS